MSETHRAEPNDRPLTILAGNRSDGHCRDCRRPVIWVVSSPHGKSVPFDREPFVLRTHESERGLRFEVVSCKDIHFASCAARRNHPRIPNADRRAATGTRRRG